MVADLLGIIWGQSNAVGFSDAFGTGGSTANADASDGNLYSAFAACTFAQLSSTAPAASGAQTYNINVGPESLQPYAAGGGNNNGCANSIGRNLVKYGLATAPWLGVCGIGSSSIPGHWLPAASVTSGVYTNFVNFINTQITNSGRNKVDFIVHQIGETDANTPSRVTNAVADITSMYASLATDVPATANAVIIIVMVNPNASLPGDGDVAGYRTQQVAYKNGATRTVVLVDPDNIPVPSDPHYRANGYWDLGVRIILALKSVIAPAATLNLGSGPAGYLQADGSICTTQSSSFPAIPRGESGRVGEAPRDVQFLFTASYTQANADHNLTGSGWTRVGGLLDSTVSTNHRQMSCWWRPVDSASMVGPDAAGNSRMPSPQITFPTSTLNGCRILTVRGIDPTNPIAAVLTNTVTATSTTFKIPSSTTPTTVPANSLALVVVAHNGTTDAVSSIANTNVSGGTITVARDSRFNPGAGTVGMAHGAAPVVGTSLAQTTITYSAATVGVGYVLVLNPDPGITSGTSTGSATVSGVGASTAASSGSSSGTASVSAVGASLVSATGTTSGTSSASGVGASAVSSSGSSVGSSTVTAIGNSLATSSGSATGSSTVSGSGSSTVSVSGSSSGTSTSSGIGASLVSTNGSSVGSSIAAAVGNSTVSVPGNSFGTSTAVGVGASTQSSTGTSNGLSSALGVGASIVSSSGLSTSTSTSSGVGASLASSTGIAVGQAIVTGVGNIPDPGSSVGLSLGTSFAQGIGFSTFASSGSAFGTCIVSGVGASTITTVQTSIIELVFDIEDIDKLSVLYDQLQVFRSPDRDGISPPYTSITDGTATSATLSGAVEGPWNLDGTSISISVDGADPVVVNFSGQDPFLPKTVRDLINGAAFPGLISSSPSNVNLLILSSPSQGTQSTLRISGTAVPILGFGILTSVGKGANPLLSENTEIYRVLDFTGLPSYWYKYRLINSVTKAASSFSVPVLGGQGLGIPTSSTVVGSVALADLSGSPIIGRRIIFVGTGQQVLPDGSGHNYGVLASVDRITVATDGNGRATVSLIKGQRLKVFIEGSTFQREFVVPTTDFDILTVASIQPDPFSIVTAPPLPIRVS